jgi:ammonia channel protein AmtB
LPNFTLSMAATAALVWLAIESVKFGKPSMVGIVTGAVAGLATITPASGFVGPAGALVIGLAGGTICYAAVGLVKRRFLIDDSLDVFAVHGVGGALGVLLTAIFVDAALGGAGLAEGRSVGRRRHSNHRLVAVLLWSLLLSFVIARPFRPSPASASAATPEDRASIFASTVNAATTCDEALGQPKCLDVWLQPADVFRSARR